MVVSNLQTFYLISVYVSIYKSIYLSIHLSIYLSIPGHSIEISSMCSRSVVLSHLSVLSNLPKTIKHETVIIETSLNRIVSKYYGC